MKRLTKHFLAIASLLVAMLLPCFGGPKPSGPVLLRLDDIQGLWGGQTLVLDANGNLFARKVIGQRKEHRHYLKLTAEELATILAFIDSSGFSEYREKARDGVPDEAHPLITLSLPGKQKISAMKWANDKDPKFDKLYEKTLKLVEQAVKSPAYETKDYDFKAAYP